MAILSPRSQNQPSAGNVASFLQHKPTSPLRKYHSNVGHAITNTASTMTSTG
jgi:hypothetical protein